jgi:hypothetical protein
MTQRSASDPDRPSSVTEAAFTVTVSRSGLSHSKYLLFDTVTEIEVRSQVECAWRFAQG